MSSPVFIFDAYGTLFDVHAAIARYAAEAGPEGQRMSEIWRGKQLEYTWTLTLSGQYVDFWQLTERALDFALARVPSVNRELKSKLLEAYFKLDAFPDARDALQKLKARGDRTGILSNGTPDMVKGAVDAAGIGRFLDAQLSVHSVHMYKPRPEVYALTTQALAIAPRDVTFVSSNRWDVMGAGSFGFRTVWVNRARMPDEYTDHAPAAVVSDLAALPAMIEG